MQAFTDFALQLTYPPNPIRKLDNTLRADEADGLALYNGRITDTVANCNGCHTLDRTMGFFGTSGGSTFEGETMEFKVPHLRNAYQKVGMFGMAPNPLFTGAKTDFVGDQVRGSGFLHDGSIPTVADFLAADVFNNVSDTDRTNLEAFVMAFETNLARICGLLRIRRDAMLDALGDEMPDGARWSRPEGGYFLWVDFPGGMDASDVLHRATEAGVTFVRGSDFFPGGAGGASSARLAFSFETPERITDGVAVLGSLLRG